MGKYKKDNGIGRITCIIAFLFLFFIMLIIAFIYYKNDMDKNIAQGIYIDKINVGKMSVATASSMLNKYYEDNINDATITLNYAVENVICKKKELDCIFYVEEIVNEAYNLSHGGNIWENMKSRRQIKKDKVHLRTRKSYNKGVIEKKLMDIENVIGKEAVNATIKYLNGKISYTAEETGIKVNFEETIKEIELYIQNNIKHGIVDVAIISQEADIKISELKKIKDIMGSFETSFNQESKSRSYNIGLAASHTNKILLMPGMTLSVNSLIGPRTSKNKFKTAKVILNNKYVEGIGGGVCQVSTTLYNAALLSGLEIVERKNHSLPSSYVAVGYDATINWDNIDLKIKNNKEHPIFICNSINNGKLEFKILGIKGEEEIKIISEKIKTIPPKIKVIKDEKMFLGEQRWELKGKNGYIVKTYRVTYKDGKEIKREDLYTDKYNAQDGIKRIGVKKKAIDKIIK